MIWARDNGSCLEGWWNSRCSSIARLCLAIYVPTIRSEQFPFGSGSFSCSVIGDSYSLPAVCVSCIRIRHAGGQLSSLILSHNTHAPRPHGIMQRAHNMSRRRTHTRFTTARLPPLTVARHVALCESRFIPLRPPMKILRTTPRPRPFGMNMDVTYTAVYSWETSSRPRCIKQCSNAPGSGCQ